MPKGISAFRNASRTQITSKKQGTHVWISDELLSEAFALFTRHHCRHGSNVPGPLEARRRAAKRKATTAAHTSISGSMFDIASLTAAQTEGGWWKRSPKPPDLQSQAAWQRSLGLPYRPPPVPEVSPDLQSQVLTQEDHQEIGIVKISTKRRYLARLKRVRTHEALMNILEDLSISLVHNPSCAMKALDCMIADRWPADEVETFLLDPRTNPEGSHNCPRLCEAAMNGDLSSDIFQVLLKRGTLPQAVRMGLVGIQDVRKILNRSIELGPSIYGGVSDSSAFANSILEAVDQSSVLCLKNLGRKFLTDWGDVVKKHEFYPSTPQLLWRLATEFDPPIKGLSWRRVSLDRDFALKLSHLVEDSIRMINRSTAIHLKHLVNLVLAQPHSLVNDALFEVTVRMVKNAKALECHETYEAERRFRASLLGFAKGDFASQNSSYLNSADDATASHNNLSEVPTKQFSITGVDRQLLREPTSMELLYALLAAAGSHESRFKMDRGAFEDFIDIAPADEDTRRILIVGLWMAMALSVDDNAVIHGLSNFEVGRKLAQRFSDEAEKHQQDVLASIIEILEACHLPAKNKLLRRLFFFSDGTLNIQDSFDSLRCNLKSLNNFQVDDLADRLGKRHVYPSMQKHFPETLARIAEAANDDLADFEELCSVLIRDTKGYIHVVTRLLSYNHQLKYHLRHACQYMSWDGTRWHHTEASQTTKALGEYTYSNIVNMITRIAWECARTKNLSNNNAFRYAYWLFHYLHKHRAPVTPRMLRALWHAGVTRNPRHPHTVVKEIYSFIVEYEGEHAAARLLNATVKGQPLMPRKVHSLDPETDYVHDHIDSPTAESAGSFFGVNPVEVQDAEGMQQHRQKHEDEAVTEQNFAPLQ